MSFIAQRIQGELPSVSLLLAICPSSLREDEKGPSVILLKIMICPFTTQREPMSSVSLFLAICYLFVGSSSDFNADGHTIGCLKSNDTLTIYLAEALSCFQFVLSTFLFFHHEHGSIVY